MDHYPDNQQLTADPGSPNWIFKNDPITERDPQIITLNYLNKMIADDIAKQQESVAASRTWPYKDPDADAFAQKQADLAAVKWYRQFLDRIQRDSLQYLLKKLKLKLVAGTGDVMLSKLLHQAVAKAFTQPDAPEHTICRTKQRTQIIDCYHHYGLGWSRFYTVTKTIDVIEEITVPHTEHDTIVGLLHARDTSNAMINPPSYTIYVNPDGTRIRRQSTNAGIMMQRYCQHHGLTTDQVAMSLVIDDQNNTHWVIGTRRNSATSPSHLVDLDPSFDNDNGTYKITQTVLYHIDTLPEDWQQLHSEALRLSVRQAEQAILAGCEIFDPLSDFDNNQPEYIPAWNPQDYEYGEDQLHLRPSYDQLKRIHVGELQDDTKWLYNFLISCELFDLADMLLIDTDAESIYNPLIDLQQSMLRHSDIIIDQAKRMDFGKFAAKLKKLTPGKHRYHRSHAFIKTVCIMRKQAYLKEQDTTYLRILNFINKKPYFRDHGAIFAI